MNLLKKNFIYGMIIAISIIVFLIGYFIFMIPSLYVSHMENRNYENVKNVHKEFLQDEDYKNINLNNPTITYTFIIPKEGNVIKIYNKFVNVDITIKDNKLLSLFNELTEKMEEKDDEGYGDIFTEIMDYIKDSFDYENSPYSIKIDVINDDYNFEKISSSTRVISDNTIISQTHAKDKLNYYTNYFAVTNRDKDYVCTYVPVMTPQIEEIKPVVLKSLPTIIGMTLLIVLIATIYYSKKIVNPIVSLSKDASYIKDNSNFDIDPIVVEGKDEIADLSKTLRDLYKKLNESFIKLSKQNEQLKKQNERAEVFLRASSHQLKTPVAASLLLADSMINEVGKFKNTKEYLPKLKEQILSMRKIIDDILNINKVVNNKNFSRVYVREITENAVFYHSIEIKNKNLNIEEDLRDVYIESDGDILYKIIENLLSNAVKYTETNEKIKIILTNEYIKIINYNAHINEKILPHIFEAFVSSISENRGHGLGLYIASYYADTLNLKLQVKNIENAVEATLSFNEVI